MSVLGTWSRPASFIVVIRIAAVTVTVTVTVEAAAAAAAMADSIKPSWKNTADKSGFFDLSSAERTGNSFPRRYFLTNLFETLDRPATPTLLSEVSRLDVRPE